MSTALRFYRVDGTVVEVCVTDRSDGDFAIGAPADDLLERRAGVMAGPWSVVRQVHGNTVVDADPTAPIRPADAILTSALNRPIAVQGADCAPVALITDHGPVGVAHVGWRGLVAGVIDAVIDRLEASGSAVTQAVVGPLIGVECYEFSPGELEDLAEELGSHISGSTSDSKAAFDLAAGVRHQLARRGVKKIDFIGGCTACAHAGYSYRGRADVARHALVAQIVSG